MRFFTFVLGISLISSISFAADVDGRWSGEIPSFGGGFGGGGQAQPTVLIFDFKADGETLTGYNEPAGMAVQTPIRDGIIKDNKIWFLIDVNMGLKMVIRYKGKVKRDKIKLTYKIVTENQAGGGFMWREQQITLNRIK